jgi:hypothetical protein
MFWDRRRQARHGPARHKEVVAGVVAAALVVALVVAVVVQVGRQSLPYERSVDLGYAALVGPLGSRSAATGAQLAALLAAAPGDQRSDVFTGLATIVADAQRTATAATSAAAPAPAVAAGLDCTTALVQRASAAAAVRTAVERLLGGSTGSGGGLQPPATAALEAAGRQIDRADVLWSTCRHALRRGPGLASVPASAWVTDPSVWAAPAVAGLVASIAGSPSLAPAPAVAIDAFTSSPPAVSAVGSGPTYMLPSATGLGLQVVVADTGNVDLSGVVVEVRAQPSGTLGAGPPVHATVNLRAGTAATVSLGGLRVVPGGDYTLVASATTAAGRGDPGGAVTAPPVSMVVSVAQAASTAAVAPSANPVRVGQSVTYSASIAGTLPQAPAPAGTVTFEDAGAAIASCSGTRLVRGAATCTLTYSTPGVHSITVVYAGTASIAGATSPAITETVNAGPAVRPPAPGSGVASGSRSSGSRSSGSRSSGSRPSGSG